MVPILHIQDSEIIQYQTDELIVGKEQLFVSTVSLLLFPGLAENNCFFTFSFRTVHSKVGKVRLCFLIFFLLQICIEKRPCSFLPDISVLRLQTAFKPSVDYVIILFFVPDLIDIPSGLKDHSGLPDQLITVWILFQSLLSLCKHFRIFSCLQILVEFFNKGRDLLRRQ